MDFQPNLRARSKESSFSTPLQNSKIKIKQQLKSKILQPSRSKHANQGKMGKGQASGTNTMVKG